MVTTRQGHATGGAGKKEIEKEKDKGKEKEKSKVKQKESKAIETPSTSNGRPKNRRKGGKKKGEGGSNGVAQVLRDANDMSVDEPARQIVIGKSMKFFLIVYACFLGLGFLLTVLSDLWRLVPGLLYVSLGLQVLATLFFLLIVPITHFSGSYYHSKWRFYQPFTGGVRFILFQALSWSFYALCLFLSIYSAICWVWVAKHTFGFLTSFGVVGLLSQVFMVSSLFVFHTSGPGTTPKESKIKKLFKAFDAFCHHNIVLAVAAVAVAAIAEYCWLSHDMVHHKYFARTAGVISITLFTIVLFNTYGVGGRIAHPESRWRFWQPFYGGAKFVVLQALSWSFFTLSLLVEIAFIISTFAIGFELFVGAAVLAGFFFILSEVLMIVSLSFFLPAESATGGKPSFSFIKMNVDEESMEQFRRLTVITVLANMQYLPFLLPILPFLLTGLPLSQAGSHWFAFFLCLTAWVVVNAYVKTLVAKSSKVEPSRKQARTTVHKILSRALPLAVASLPAVLSYCNYQTQAFPAWVFLTLALYCYFYLTYVGEPEVHGGRYLGESLTLFKGFTLYSILGGIEDYFKANILSAAPLDPKSTYIYGFHPHGVQPFTVFWIQISKSWRENFKGIKFSVMSASVTHYVPLMRDILQWLGGREVSRESICTALETNNSVLLVPGGQQEMMESQSKIEQIRLITKHKGFIKLAMQYGIPLVPVLSFNEVEVMDFVRLPSLQKFFISRIGLPVPFFPYGLFGLPIPRPTPCTVVFGRPIPVTKNLEPTEKELDELAKVYFGEIKQIFLEYKDRAGCTNHKLVLI